MPAVTRLGAWRFFFYAGDRDEPCHVHVERGGQVAKFWLDPVRLESSGGFNRVELNSAYRMVEQNRGELVEAWHDYFGN